MTREMETWLLDSRVSNNGVVEHRSRRPVLSPLRNCVDTRQMSCLTILGVEMQAVETDAQRHQHTQRDALETMSHILCYAQQCGLIITPISHKHKTIKKVKVAHTQLLSVGFRS